MNLWCKTILKYIFIFREWRSRSIYGTTGTPPTVGKVTKGVWLGSIRIAHSASHRSIWHRFGSQIAAGTTVASTSSIAAPHRKTIGTSRGAGTTWMFMPRLGSSILPTMSYTQKSVKISFSTVAQKELPPPR